ncbi:hypothetical protein R4K92_02850 [Brachyspira intermedia]|uniref:hypothetical protein n=1 Tax=Brachyspira intermedia TaxID=84377 RepID=UPI003004989F
MKKIILILTILASIAAVSCNSKQAPMDKPLTSNVPSDDKAVREGTPLSQWDDSQANKSMAINASVSANNNAGTVQDGYNLLQRLYSTVWYQSESDYDDGRLETEEEFVFFNENSEMVKREYENGKIDGRDDYSALEHIADITLKNTDDRKSRNACIVKNIEKDGSGYDMEFEGYYLVDRNTLYIVDGDTQDIVQRKLEDIVNGNTQKYLEDKFVLSTKAL